MGLLRKVNIPERLKAYVAEFDAALDHDEFNSPRFPFRLLFKKKLVSKPGQADSVVEFIDPNWTSLKRSISRYWVKKEVERKKFLPSGVVQEVQKAGFPKFRLQHEHIQMWKAEDAKNPGKGYGVQVEDTWYWYETGSSAASRCARRRATSTSKPRACEPFERSPCCSEVRPQVDRWHAPGSRFNPARATNACQHRYAAAKRILTTSKQIARSRAAKPSQ